MLNKSIPILCLLFLCYTSCKQAIPEPNINDDNQTYFGEEFKADGAITYDELYSRLDDQESVENVKVKATVTAVCQAKGCWMNLTNKIGSTKEQMFVKFKDYGFFMPKDIAGQEVIVDGRAYKEVTSVDELRHYAEDEGLAEAEILAITEPKEELKFMANGVILLN